MGIYLRGKSWYYDFVHHGARYVGSFGPVPRSVAKEELARKKAAVLETRLNPAKARKSPRLDTFADDYLTWAHANCKPLTVHRAQRTLARFTAFVGPTKRLNEVTPWNFEQWKRTRKEAGKAPGTINTELLTLKSIFAKAKAWGKLSEHPGASVKLLQNPRQKIRFLSEDEEVRLLAVCSPALRRVVHVGLLTGFRRQELISLRLEDVDMNDGTVSVAACYAKNGESRTLPIGPRLRAVLQDALTASGSAATVLVNALGLPWSRNTLGGQFRAACQAAGIGSLGLHVLRHTFASRLTMAGVDLKTTQELMGHKSIEMTLRYAHLSPQHRRSAMETLEARFSAPSPATFHNTPSPTPAREAEKQTAA
ncbi:MAG: site-specific integrase [Deltaproteobacteria bacterium]|nr:site-specific integrase [Deltaproteobacteria bacterium]